MKESMSEIELKISFNTPAFLGNAEQQGQWRTPPFKALLRQWWRIVKASEGLNIAGIRDQEKELFGAAAEEKKDNNGDKSKYGRSKLLIKFDKWSLGTSNAKPNTGKVKHIEVQKAPGGLIDSELYLGYGPISLSGAKRSISISDSNTLRLCFPVKNKDEFIKTVKLIAYFGTIGSRSRNGWGSINIENAKCDNENIDLGFNKNLISCFAKEYDKALRAYDWASCIGKDSKGLLIWKTNDCRSYEEVIRLLAKIKIDFRTHFKFHDGDNAFKPSERHIISYPVTKHGIKGMKNARNANQIRFKVIKDNNTYYGLIFHMPCKVSDNFFDNKSIINDYRKLEENVWGKVHISLDNLCKRL